MGSRWRQVRQASREEEAKSDPFGALAKSQKTQQTLRFPAPNDANIPRFYAAFDFGYMQGHMRLYPPVAVRPNAGPFSIKDNPTFEYVFRARETGEDRIDLDADSAAPEKLTFGDYGTTFEGIFNDICVGGIHNIKGRPGEEE